ncbi:MAG: lectin like domain-containing protein [Candidatus Zixiibacteriota bacterium]
MQSHSKLIIFLLLLVLFIPAVNSSDNVNKSDSKDFLCGDASNNGSINILDITYLIAYLYKGGPPPAVPDQADVNDNGIINILDITYMIAYLYKGGPELDCPDQEPEPEPDTLPTTFDLRNVDGINYVTSVKSQSGGTCWAHATIASIESNLLMTGNWTAAGEAGEPNLAEYHLDWWNGFNDNWDPDNDGYADNTVHDGGTYQMSSAYLSRGDGAVRDIDGQSFSVPPDHYNDSFHIFYVRDIEWYSNMIWEGEPVARIDLIKRKVMEHGGVATGMYTQYLNGGSYYCPPEAEIYWPDHTVLIVGWDDNRNVGAPLPGAWLCKNSWGTGSGIDGYFWGSYYDAVMGIEPMHGATSFMNVERMAYDKIYFYDWHGWSDYFWNNSIGFNAYVAEGNEAIQAVNFVTVQDSVDYTVTVYDSFDGINLSGVLATVSGMIEFKGFHTVDLPSQVELTAGNDFYIYLNLYGAYMAFDASTYVKNIPGSSKSGVFIESKSKPGQSYYPTDDKTGWKDLYDYDQSANFCIKGLAIVRSMRVLPSTNISFEGPKVGPFEPLEVTYKFAHKYTEKIDYQVSLNPAADWLVLSGDTYGSLEPGDTAEVTVMIDETMAAAIPQGYYTTSIEFVNYDYPEDNTSREVEFILGTPVMQYEWMLDTDPGWTCEDSWAFGSPTGGGGYFGFGTDPVGGYTGDNVYGYNIDGNYPTVLSPVNLTMGPIDCSDLVKVSLNFYRWLASDGYGQGDVQISVNGTEWTNVWTGYDGVNNVWTNTDLDISDYADLAPALYVRWVMRVELVPMYTFGGWNIDDVRINAIYDSTGVK